MALASGAVAGAIGGGVAITVLAPLTAANNFIGSFFFGDGMIIGERKAYQHDWPKIKKRLDNGEDFITILEEYTIDNTTAVMSTAKQIIQVVKPIWFEMVRDYLTSIPQDLMQMLTSPQGVTESSSIAKEAANATISQATMGFIPQAFAEQYPSGPVITEHELEVPQWMMNQPIGKLQTAYLREKNNITKLKLAKAIQLKLQQNSKILKPDKPLTITEKLAKTKQYVSQLPNSNVKMIATLYAQVVYILRWYRKTGTNSYRSKLFTVMKQYNRFVQEINKRNLTIDTARTIELKKIIRRYK